MGNTGSLKPIPEKDELQKKLQTSPYISQFVKESEKLLKETNRPNVITYAQFEPYMAIFKVDLAKLENDSEYKALITRLTTQFRVNLSINIHEPILVVVSEEDQTVIGNFDRVFSRIKSDVLPEGKSVRQNLPQTGPMTHKQRREDMMVGAMVTDVTKANETPEQIENFWRMRQESALITKRFVEHNLSADKRDEFIGGHSAPTPVAATSSSDDDVSLVFDDD